MSTMSWYHGQLSRMKAEELLMSSGKDGSFLVRESESMKGAYALCVLCQGRIHQYRVLPSPDEAGLTTYIIKAVQGVQQHKYCTLDDLIKGYEHDNNGLACGLKYPVGKDEEAEDDSDDEGTILIAATSKQFSSRYSQLQFSGTDRVFEDSIKNYISNGLLKDIERVQCGATSTPHLRRLLSKSAKEFQQQMDLFLARIDIIEKLFDPNAIHLSKKKEPDLPTGPVDLDHFLDALPECRKSVKDLEKLALSSLQDVCKSYDISKEEEPLSPDKKPLTPFKPCAVPPVSFEVKTDGLKNNKMKLIVDVSGGSLQIMKSTRDVKEDVATYVHTHDKILQLIKSRATNTKLTIKLAASKQKEFIFEDMRKRETFCQLVQQMKNMHSHSSEIDQISVYIGSWNMGDAVPSGSLRSWLQSEGSGKSLDSSFVMMPHDLYAFGTQESAMSERDWVNKLKRELELAVNLELKTVAVCSLWHIRLVVLVKPEHIHRISHVEQSTVKTGIANAFGNKGAVAISLHFNGTSMCFINCHLTSGIEKCSRRNQNFFDILKGLQLGLKEPFDVTTGFQHLFWFGDLNYRLQDAKVQGILRLICENKLNQLCADHDQLKKEQTVQKAFAGFLEEDITFPPTYRYRRGSNKEYVWEKVKKTGIRINAPSWCDRVLWRSYPEVYIKNTAYGCTNDILSSDHHPVFAAFDVGVLSQYVSCKENIQGSLSNNINVNIIFTEVETIIKTKMSNNKYCLEFRSNCMEGKQKSKANREWVTGSGLHDSSARPRWSSKEIPELIPAIPDYEYLEDQHIFVAVKSEDSDEYFGECVLALKFKFGSLPSSFKATLSHLGEVTGKIMGKMHVKTDEKLLRTMTSKRRGKSYELVSIEETGSSHPPCLQDASLLTVDTVNSHEAYTSPSVPRKKVILQSQSFDVTPQLPPSTSTKHRPYSCHYGMQPPAAEAAINESFHWGKTSVPSDIATPPMLPVRHHIPFDRQASEPSSKLHKPPLPVRNISIIPEQENLSSEQAQDVQIAATTKKVEPEEEDDDTSYFEYPPGPPVPPRQGINAMLGRTLPPVPLPPAPKQSQGNLPPLPPLPTSMNKAVDITEDDKEVCEDYETLTWPKTISEWLMNLGLPQYVTRLMDNGWDSVVFLDSIMNSDLIEAGVTNEEHRQRMLKSVADMKQQ